MLTNPSPGCNISCIFALSTAGDTSICNASKLFTFDVVVISTISPFFNSLVVLSLIPLLYSIGV